MARPEMGRVESSGIVKTRRAELFWFTDWCYNVPEWFSAISKTWIVKLPDSNGLGKITHYVGKMMGKEMEWDARAVEWKENECWMMKASSGTPAKMNMYLAVRFRDEGLEGTKVTAVMGYKIPYPIIGPLIDRFYIEREAQKLVNTAIEGMQRASSEHRIPPISLQLVRRKVDRPDYTAQLQIQLTSRDSLGERN